MLIYKLYGILILSLFLIITVNAVAPVSNFTSNITNGTIYPLVVGFTDDSTNAPTSWNWSFGDGRWFNTTDISLKNATYQYAVAGKYTVNLTVSNVDGSNTAVKTDYINLTADADSYLKSWLHMNGTNGSTAFVGEEGIAWSVNGAAYITTNTYKFGGASGAFKGFNPYISTVSSNAFNFSTNDFTIEMWVNATSNLTGVQIIGKTNANQNNGWGLDNNNGTENGWDFWMGNDTTGSTPSFRIPQNTWTHVVIERESGLIKVYINGNLAVTKSGLSGNFDTVNPVRIGIELPSIYYNGYLDEFRISNGISRWKTNFTTPYNQYRGILETNYPDINPNSTFRYKTDPTGNAYIDNLTPRNRTLQIQNITNTSYVTGEIVFDPLHGFVKSVQVNNSYFSSGLTLVSSAIDNTLGTIAFNISRANGFNTSSDRASILDYTMVYYNFSDGHDITIQYFAYGYLVNGTTNKYYPVHNFLGTPVTYGDWNFTADFTADNLTPATGTGLVTFTSTFTGSYPNRWNWSFGDGEYNDGTNSTIVHRYATGGLKTVTLNEHMWQDDTTANSTITRVNYINVLDTLPVADFTSTAGGTTVPVSVYFVDTSTNYPTSWEWDFGDGNTSVIQNPTHVYTVCGDFNVSLRSWNTAGWSLWENKTNLVHVEGCAIPTPTPIPGQATAKIEIKVMDTKNLIIIGVIIIIIAALVTYIYTLATKK